MDHVRPVCYVTRLVKNDAVYSVAKALRQTISPALTLGHHPHHQAGLRTSYLLNRQPYPARPVPCGRGPCACGPTQPKCPSPPPLPCLQAPSRRLAQAEPCSAGTPQLRPFHDNPTAVRAGAPALFPPRNSVLAWLHALWATPSPEPESACRNPTVQTPPTSTLPCPPRVLRERRCRRSHAGMQARVCWQHGHARRDSWPRTIIHVARARRQREA